MRRRSVPRCALVTVCITTISGQPLGAQTKRPQVLLRQDATVERALRWAAAVLDHQPGARDRQVEEIARWDAAALTEAAVEIDVIGRLMRNARARGFVMSGNATGLPPQLVYSDRQLAMLQMAANDIARAGLDDTDLVARGILLHTDIAFLAGGAGTILQFSDGRHLGLQRGVDHWAVARAFAVSLGGRLADTRLWYRATLAEMAAIDVWNVKHTDAAAEARPPDAELLFLAGSLHETLASPRVQASVADARIPGDVVIRVGSSRDELRLAASLLKRALDLNPMHTEARIHYGRVLTLLNRAADAITELRRTAAAATEPEQRYYAWLFLGGALEAANRRDEAQAAYESAMALFPRAQSPRLALSQLAARDGNRANALRALEPLLDPPIDEGTREDPWWTYLRSPGRNAELLMAQARERLATKHGGAYRQ